MFFYLWDLFKTITIWTHYATLNWKLRGSELGQRCWKLYTVGDIADTAPQIRDLYYFTFRVDVNSRRNMLMVNIPFVSGDIWHCTLDSILRPYNTVLLS